jgi:23S rRNA (adenine2030-N6)-methyltransferase
MNYRHAFHAGNFADCVKHALLVTLVRLLQRKEKPLFLLDTHAGAGLYALTAPEAEKSGEWREGIGRLRRHPSPPLAPYLTLTGDEAHYAGSPLLLHRLARPQDRVVCCEQVPEVAASLRTLLRSLGRGDVHCRDGWEALRALLPPPERRGLIFIDPPFEARSDYAALAAGLRHAYRRFPQGVYAGWFPLKGKGAAHQLYGDLKSGGGLADVIAVEFWRRPPLDPQSLAGSGLIVVNPPFGFEEEAYPVLEALREALGDGAGAGFAITRLIGEGRV